MHIRFMKNTGGVRNLVSASGVAKSRLPFCHPHREYRRDAVEMALVRILRDDQIFEVWIVDRVLSALLHG